MCQHSEIELLRRVSNDDRRALAELYDRYQPQIARFVSRLSSRPDLVEEVVNDTMVVVWRNADRFRGQSRPSTWILGIAYKTMLKRLRQLSRRPEEKPLSESRLVDRVQPEAELDRLQTRQAIQHALDRLSPEQRAVVELTFFHERSYQEIAEIVGCPENTVKSRMFHARKRLKRLLPTLGAGSVAG